MNNGEFDMLSREEIDIDGIKKKVITKIVKNKTEYLVTAYKNLEEKFIYEVHLRKNNKILLPNQEDETYKSIEQALLKKRKCDVIDVINEE